MHLKWFSLPKVLFTVVILRQLVQMRTIILNAHHYLYIQSLCLYRTTGWHDSLSFNIRTQKLKCWIKGSSLSSAILKMCKINTVYCIAFQLHLGLETIITWHWGKSNLFILQLFYEVNASYWKMAIGRSLSVICYKLLVLNKLMFHSSLIS